MRDLDSVGGDVDGENDDRESREHDMGDVRMIRVDGWKVNSVSGTLGHGETRTITSR